jgi:hypothetical protein
MILRSPSMVTTDDLLSVLLHKHRTEIRIRMSVIRVVTFKSKIFCDTKPCNKQMGANISEELLPQSSGKVYFYIFILVHFNHINISFHMYILKKVNVYLPSLIMKVPNHLYVLGDTYTCHT